MVVLDKELVKERPFAVVNLIYEPEIARLQGVTARVDARLHGRGDNKAEARHVHRRGGQLFCANMRASISTPRPVRPSRAKLPFAAVDVAGNFRGVERGLNGHATEVPGALDLTKFSRQQGCFASNIISKWRALRRKRLHPMPAMI
jgi:hypothetical protein